MKKELKVSQLENKNQFLIETPTAIYFQSYDSVCAKFDFKKRTLYLNKDWDYSHTTRKHLYIFINDYCYSSVLEDMVIYAKNKRQAIKRLIKDKIIKISKKLD